MIIKGVPFRRFAAQNKLLYFKFNGDKMDSNIYSTNAHLVELFALMMIDKCTADGIFS